MYSPALSTLITPTNAQPGRDFAEDLIDYDLEFIINEDYLEVGEILKVPRWILYISVIRCQLNDLIATVLPILSKDNISFRMVANELVARKLLNGSQGVAEIGKIIKIYTENDSRAVLIARKLAEATHKLRGPDIPGCFHLGGCLYTVYEDFQIPKKADFSEPIFRIPKGIRWPFSEIAKRHKIRRSKFLACRYLPVMVMKSDVKGKVFKCISFRKILNPNWCLVKQGKNNMCSDDFGRDVQDRLRWQERLNQELKGKIDMPDIIDVFIENGDLYLMMDFIEGMTLNDLIDRIFKNRDLISINNQIVLVGHLISISEGLMTMHNNGIVHRDPNPENFLIDKFNKLFFIDMELAYSIKTGEPNPPFVWGTEGFMSPEQLANETPTIEQDIYGLGVLIACTLTGLSPADCCVNDADQAGVVISRFVKKDSLVEAVLSCVHKEPSYRPDILTIMRHLLLYHTSLTNSR